VIDPRQSAAACFWDAGGAEDSTTGQSQRPLSNGAVSKADSPARGRFLVVFVVPVFDGCNQEKERREDSSRALDRVESFQSLKEF